PADRAYTGLTSQASVVARWESHARAGSPAYAAAYERDFQSRLAKLPRTPEIRAMLVRQREKAAATTREALLAEVRDTIAPAIQRRGGCGLEEADQLVRVQHRLTEIMPV